MKPSERFNVLKEGHGTGVSFSFYCLGPTGSLCHMLPSCYAACTPPEHKIGSTSRGLYNIVLSLQAGGLRCLL